MVFEVALRFFPSRFQSLGFEMFFAMALEIHRFDLNSD